MTHIYLAYPGGGAPARVFRGYKWTGQENLLVALPYVRTYLQAAHRYNYQPARLMLDSGAFSAWNSGHVIDIDMLVRESKHPRWTESVGLDVIGSWTGSKANAIRMRALGSTAIPVFHVGDPWPLLEFYCKHWPKVGLSCRFGEPVRESIAFYETCFARAWPHQFHSFGWTSPTPLLMFPFHSADSSSWEHGPLAFASGIRIRGAKLPPTSGLATETIVQSIKYSIRYYLDLGAKLASHWRSELEQLTS